MDKKILVVATVGTFLLIFQFFILIPLYENNQVNIFFQGYEEGYEEAIISIYNKTENCNTVPVFVENNTKNLIDFSCVNSNENLP